VVIFVTWFSPVSDASITIWSSKLSEPRAEHNRNESNNRYFVGLEAKKKRLHVSIAKEARTKQTKKDREKD